MSAKVSYIFLAPGVEEVEAMATIDALRRAHIKVVSIGVSDNLLIKGSSGQSMMADILISEVSTEDADWLILPGGDPGAWLLSSNQEVKDRITSHFKKGGRLAAICAAPAIVLAPLGILEGKVSTCYPAMADVIRQHGAKYDDRPVVVQPGLITSQGPGTALLFAIEIIRATKGAKMAQGIAQMMRIPGW